MKIESKKSMLSDLASLLTSGSEDRPSQEYDKALHKLSDILDAEKVGIYVFDRKGRPKDVFTSFAGTRWNTFLTEYEQIRHKDPVFRCIRRQQAEAIDGATLLGKEGWKYSQIGQWMRTWKLGYSLQGAIFSNDGKLLATLNFARRDREPAFSETELNEVGTLCAQLTDHIREATSGIPRHAGRPYGHNVPGNESTSPDSFLRGLSSSIVTDDQCQPVYPPGDESSCSYLVYAQEIKANIEQIRTMHSSSAQTAVGIPDANAAIPYLTTILLPGIPRLYVSSLIWPDFPNQPRTTAFPERQFSELPPRARRVAELLVRGYSNKLIARELSLSENTVKDHIKRIFDFYGITHRSQLPALVGLLGAR